MRNVLVFLNLFREWYLRHRLSLLTKKNGVLKREGSYTVPPVQTFDV